jgi:hypothetical protein
MRTAPARSIPPGRKKERIFFFLKKKEAKKTSPAAFTPDGTSRHEGRSRRAQHAVGLTDKSFGNYILG